MELANSFEVSIPLERAWQVLTDIERVAPCMPGVQLKEVDGDIYKGVCTVKVGPITQSFEGTARFEELNEAAGRAVLQANGRERRGQGTATAKVTTVLTPDAKKTRVSIVTELTITGRAAQFGNSMLADVSERLLKEFVERLERDVIPEHRRRDEADSSAPRAIGSSGTSGEAQSNRVATPSDVTLTSTDTSRRRIISSEPAEPLDLVGLSASLLAKRMTPVLSVLAIVAAAIGTSFHSWSSGRWCVLAVTILFAGVLLVNVRTNSPRRS